MKRIGRFLVSSSLLIAGATVLGSFTDAQAGCQKQPIAAAQETVKGNGFLCSNQTDVKARIQASGLTPCDAYTFWFVYIDDAAKCAAEGEPICFGENDPNDVPDAAFGRLSDVVAPKDGKASISGSVPGLTLSKGSQVLFLLKGHGAANTSDNLVRAVSC